MSQPVAFDLPPLTSSTKNLLIGLFVLYAVELSARNVFGLPVDRLAWSPFDAGFAPWQPATRYFVQGNDVFNVVLAGVALYFLVPVLERLFSAQQILQATGAAVAGGTLLALTVDGVGLARGGAMGFAPLLAAGFALFGLAQPNAVIRLFFVLPVPASVIAWGTGLVTFLLLLASMSMSAADAFGTWAAAVGWWFWLGPGGRRRRLSQKASSIERTLRVIEGGRRDPTIH